MLIFRLTNNNSLGFLWFPVNTIMALSFGLIADVQFAFAPDRVAPGRPRFYQNARQLLRDAVNHWNNENTSFVVNLGDIIDGVNVKYGKSTQALDIILTEFDKSDVEVIHVLGNHELSNFSRQQLTSTPLYRGCNIVNKGKCANVIQDFQSTTPVFYFTFTVKESPGFRFIVLDTFDESLLGRNKSSLEYQNALNIIRKHNNNKDINSDNGLEGIDQRFTGECGGIGNQQLQWLDTVLTEADLRGEKVVLFSHSTLHPKCGVLAEDVPWNCEEILELLYCHPCVKVSLSGHVHENVYHCDNRGIHYRTFNAVVEADKNHNAYATVHLSNDKMYLEGHGQIDSQICLF